MNVPPEKPPAEKPDRPPEAAGDAPSGTPGVAAARDRTLPLWGALPFVIGALCGLVAFLGDLGTVGAMLWILFGVGWAWLGFALLLDGILRYWRGRQARSSPDGLTSRPKPL